MAANLNTMPPKITIVTPSYNQGQFLDDTIQSVLGQGYPNLEYIVMDGGSTDNSAEIIKKYEKHLAHWVSEKDGGQAAAINAGFSRATGDILGWLNSDDMYLPGALTFAAGRLNAAVPEIVFGNCLHINEHSSESFGSDVVDTRKTKNLKLYDYIIQPSSFWTKAAWDAAGALDSAMHFGFDWEWFLRAEKLGISLSPVSKYLSVYRIHDAHKTGTGGDRRQQELAEVYGRYAGPHYKELYLQCCQRKPEVADFQALMARRRLRRLAGPLLRLKFPALYRQGTIQEIQDLLDMG